jgi:ADP-ribose pyrophosphatase YjhB (NUDIX family)
VLLVPDVVHRFQLYSQAGLHLLPFSLKRGAGMSDAVPVCDHTSVGILVWRHDKLLLVERRLPPYGLAPPAGHVDQHLSYQAAACAELLEEVGLIATDLKLIAEGTKHNPCRRLGGNWHHWKIFSAEALGEVRPSSRETKGFRWCSKDELSFLAEPKVQGYGADGCLEPVWHEWLRELGMLTSPRT